jgi:hypothetical protein
VLVFVDGNMDTLKRRSWDKSMLSSQPEKEEPEPAPAPAPKEASPPSPVIQVLPPTAPLPSPQKLEPGEPEKKEDEKEKVKESSRLTRKFKQMYKGERCKRLLLSSSEEKPSRLV